MLAGGMEVASDQVGVEKVADADGERDYRYGRGGPGVAFVFDRGDQAHRNDEAHGSAGEQDAVTTRARGFRQLGDHGDIDAASDGGEALFGAQFTHAEVGVHGGHGDAEAHDDCDQADEI